MALVAGHQVVGASGIGALQKLIVARVLRDPERARRLDESRMILYELEKLMPETPADFQFRRESTSRYSAKTASET